MVARPGTGDFDARIVRHSVAEQVAHHILELVRTGALKSGDQLPPERELAVSMQVSRPSVREAIRGLTILGVVRTRQGGGAYISNLAAEDLLGPLQFFISLEEVNLQELYDARAVIESDVARQAAKNISDADLDRIDGILIAQKPLTGDAARFWPSDSEFHTVIWQGCGNAFLHRIGKSLNVLGHEVRRMASETPGLLKQSHRDHLAIAAALRARDPDRAALAAASHMRNVLKSTLDARRRKEAAT